MTVDGASFCVGGAAGMWAMRLLGRRRARVARLCALRNAKEAALRRGESDPDAAAAPLAEVGLGLGGVSLQPGDDAQQRRGAGAGAGDADPAGKRGAAVGGEQVEAPAVAQHEVEVGAHLGSIARLRIRKLQQEPR